MTSCPFAWCIVNISTKADSTSCSIDINLPSELSSLLFSSSSAASSVSSNRRNSQLRVKGSMIDNSWAFVRNAQEMEAGRSGNVVILRITDIENISFYWSINAMWRCGETRRHHHGCALSLCCMYYINEPNKCSSTHSTKEHRLRASEHTINKGPKLRRLFLPRAWEARDRRAQEAAAPASSAKTQHSGTHHSRRTVLRRGTARLCCYKHKNGWKVHIWKWQESLVAVLHCSLSWSRGLESSYLATTACYG